VRRYKLWIAGEWQESGEMRPVMSPYSGEIVAQMPQCDARQMEQAISASVDAFQKFKRVSRYTRSQLLMGIAQEISLLRGEFVDRIVSEAGKPVTLADAEVGRAIQTFVLAAEESKRLLGEIVPVDLDPAGRSYEAAQVHWVPRGPVLAITPFNFPLNLVAHKVAPALAVGASVILKPPPQAPGAAVLLADVFARVAKRVSDATEVIPPTVLQVLAATNEVIEHAVTDSRVSILSFTGSDKVGWLLQQKAIRKRVALELGGNAAVIVHKDANLSRAAARCAFGGFAYAGQVCISVQRVFVHESVAAKFQKLLLAEIAKVKFGDPQDRSTLLGPLIDRHATERILGWIHEACADGAKVLVGGKVLGHNILEPTLVTEASRNAKLNTEEVFGPVVVLESYEDLGGAIEAVNSSRFGLQAGLFTDSASVIRQVTSELDVGGLIVNDIPTYRADNMPYGGVKESGLGREGVVYAMRDYCEQKVVVHFKH
jgi:acyl-CoA reductase-like NAD-dependent aldehyde dehydrogenase